MESKLLIGCYQHLINKRKHVFNSVRGWMTETLGRILLNNIKRRTEIKQGSKQQHDSTLRLPCGSTCFPTDTCVLIKLVGRNTLKLLGSFSCLHIRPVTSCFWSPTETIVYKINIIWHSVRPKTSD